MECELSETYYFTPSKFDENGRRCHDGARFRDVVKEFEVDFHRLHSADYALNLYANSNTMRLLSRSCDAAPFVIYGMELMILYFVNLLKKLKKLENLMLSLIL